MLAKVAIVRKDAADAADLARVLRGAGHDASEFTDPIAFLSELLVPGGADAVEVLVIDAVFGASQPHGFSLANMLAIRRCEARMVFVGSPEFADVASGEYYVALPASTSRLLAIVIGLLKATALTATRAHN